MNDNFFNYLGSLPLTETVKDRIAEVIDLNQKIINDEILDIFLCDFKDEEGNRTYTSFWLFTENDCIECKEFLTSNDFDITPYNGMISYCQINFSNFDLEEADNKSFLKIDFSFPNGIRGNLIATGKNCEQAFHIYKEYVVANLQKNVG